MKKFTIPCDFAGQKAPFNIYIGEASRRRNPLHYQAMWLREERGGEMPAEVLDSFQKLADIAHENNVSFEELCVYALGTANGNADAEGEPTILEDRVEPFKLAKISLESGISLGKLRKMVATAKERGMTFKEFAELAATAQDDDVPFEALFVYTIGQRQSAPDPADAPSAPTPEEPQSVAPADTTLEPTASTPEPIVPSAPVPAEPVSPPAEAFGSAPVAPVAEPTLAAQPTPQAPAPPESEPAITSATASENTAKSVVESAAPMPAAPMAQPQAAQPQAAPQSAQPEAVAAEKRKGGFTWKFWERSESNG